MGDGIEFFFMAGSRTICLDVPDLPIVEIDIDIFVIWLVAEILIWTLIL